MEQNKTYALTIITIQLGICYKQVTSHSLMIFHLKCLSDVSTLSATRAVTIYAMCWIIKLQYKNLHFEFNLAKFYISILCFSLRPSHLKKLQKCLSYIIKNNVNHFTYVCMYIKSKQNTELFIHIQIHEVVLKKKIKIKAQNKNMHIKFC